MCAKKTVVAGIVVPGAGKQPRKQIRTFNTMTADLLELADWLTAQGVTHVALESRGSRYCTRLQRCRRAAPRWTLIGGLLVALAMAEVNSGVAP